MVGSAAHAFFYWGGWSALVAIGTLALATVTYTLVRTTKLLAQSAEADVRAQWTPVLLVRDRIQGDMRGRGRRGIIYDDERGRLVVYVENVGRGPAFDIQPSLDGFELPGPGYGVPAGTTLVPGAMGSRVYTTMAPGELRAFEWKPDRTQEVYSGRFSYVDTSGTFYATRFEVDAGAELLELRWQGVEPEPPPPGLAWWQRWFPP
jgi:hypothetical protein